MNDSRTRILTLAATLATVGIFVSAASCTGPVRKSSKGSETSSKTTGPALVKGDKTVAAPTASGGVTTSGAGGASVSGSAGGVTAARAPVASAHTSAVVVDRTGAPLPPPVRPRGTQPAPAPRTVPAPRTAPASTATASTGGSSRPAPLPPPRTTGLPAPPPPPVAGQGGRAPAPRAPAPTATAPAPTASTAGAQSEADRLLTARIEELELERQKNAILVEDYLEHARDSAASHDHEATSDWSRKALDLDHDNAEAEALLRTARSALGDRDAEIKSLSDILHETKTVKREQQTFDVQRYWTTGMEAKAEGNFAEAEHNLELAHLIVLHDPNGVDWKTMKRDIERELEEVRDLKATAEKGERAREARSAYMRVKEEEAKRRLAEVEKRNALFESAMSAFENEEWARAETMLEDYLDMVPGDTNAQQLLATSRRAKHQRASDDSLALQRERFREWRLEMKETTIPYHKILTWPSQQHWDRITELRAGAGVIDQVESDSPDTASTKNKLRSERVSFQFQGAEFNEVIRYIADTRQVNIVVDSQVAPDLEAVPITLTLNDVTIEEALGTLNRIAGDLTYVVRGTVVFITKPEFAREAPIVQVHSVGDLTVALTNFIAPNLQLLPAGAEEDEENPRFGASTEGVSSFGGAEDLIALITNNVADPDYWTEEGISIAASGEDKLVVVAEPGAQRQVASFLDDLRAFAGLVVTIETRFLTVTDNFIQDVGIDIRGIGGAGGSSPPVMALLDDVTNGLLNNASGGFDNSGVGLPANASAKPSSGAFFNNGSDGDYRTRTENVFDRSLGTNITNVGGALIQYTLIDDTNLSLILRAVEKSQEGRVLQAPSVTVFNTQRANITLINQLTFIQDFDVEVAQTAFIADPIIGIIQDGLVLDVQPTVSHDRKYITLQLRPTIANLVRPIPTFTTSLGAFTTAVTIQIPELQVQRASTTVRVPDGGTLLLGGLKNIRQQDLKSETPWISSIPFVSFFFSRKGTAEEMDNLMVIVKATITDLQEQETRFRR